MNLEEVTCVPQDYFHFLLATLPFLLVPLTLCPLPSVCAVIHVGLQSSIGQWCSGRCWCSAWASCCSACWSCMLHALCATKQAFNQQHAIIEALYLLEPDACVSLRLYPMSCSCHSYFDFHHRCVSFSPCVLSHGLSLGGADGVSIRFH